MEEMIMWDKYDNKYRKVVDVEVVRELEADLYEANNRIADLMNIIDERDEIIDKMAEQLTSPIHDKEGVIKYFEEECNK